MIQMILNKFKIIIIFKSNVEYYNMHKKILLFVVAIITVIAIGTILNFSYFNSNLHGEEYKATIVKAYNSDGSNEIINYLKESNSATDEVIAKNYSNLLIKYFELIDSKNARGIELMIAGGGRYNEDLFSTDSKYNSYESGLNKTEEDIQKLLNGNTDFKNSLISWGVTEPPFIPDGNKN